MILDITTIRSARISLSSLLLPHHLLCVYCTELISISRSLPTFFSNIFFSFTRFGRCASIIKQREREEEQQKTKKSWRAIISTGLFVVDVLRWTNIRSERAARLELTVNVTHEKSENLQCEHNKRCFEVELLLSCSTSSGLLPRSKSESSFHLRFAL